MPGAITVRSGAPARANAHFEHAHKLAPDDIETQFTDFLEKRNGTPDDPNDTTATDDPAGDTTTPPADVSSSAPVPNA